MFTVTNATNSTTRYREKNRGSTISIHALLAFSHPAEHPRRQLEKCGIQITRGKKKKKICLRLPRAAHAHNEFASIPHALFFFPRVFLLLFCIGALSLLPRESEYYFFSTPLPVSLFFLRLPPGSLNIFSRGVFDFIIFFFHPTKRIERFYWISVVGEARVRWFFSPIFNYWVILILPIVTDSLQIVFIS